MNIRTVATTPFSDQKPGTSGLRKKVAVFQTPNYLENFVQAVFDTILEMRTFPPAHAGAGRRRPLLNREAIQVILRMAAANGFAKVLVGQGGILSTPAASCVIRKYAHLRRPDPLGQPQSGRARGRLRHQVQHAPTAARRRRRSPTRSSPAARCSTSYRILDGADIDLDRCGTQMLGGMAVEVIDPVADYAELMESLFDFAAIRELHRRRLSRSASTPCTR